METASKAKATKLSALLEKLTDDFGPEVGEIPLSVIFGRLLEDHWDEVKTELRNNAELLSEIGTWDDVIEQVIENHPDTLTNSISAVCKAIRRHDFDAIQFIEDIKSNMRLTSIVRG